MKPQEAMETTRPINPFPSLTGFPDTSLVLMNLPLAQETMVLVLALPPAGHLLKSFPSSGLSLCIRKIRGLEIPFPTLMFYEIKPRV